MPAISTCYGAYAPELFDRLSRIRFLAFDIDGTITEGGVYLGNGDQELKKFYTKDGLGMSQIIGSGVILAAITGRCAELTARRMAELKVPHVLQGEWDKKRALTELCRSLGIPLERSACIGDDLNDLPMFEAAGFSACPADAHPYMLKIADLALSFRGGQGAMRQLCDLIMMAQGSLNLDGGPRDRNA